MEPGMDREAAIARNTAAYEIMRDLRKTNAAFFRMMARVVSERSEGWRPDGSQPKDTRALQERRGASNGPQRQSRTRTR